MSDKKIKCRVFKVDKDSQHYCYECGSGSEYPLFAVGNDWWELDREEYVKLCDSVRIANRGKINRRGYTNQPKFYYFIIQEVTDYEDNGLNEIFNTADEFIVAQKEYEKKQKEKEKKERDKKKRAAEERKRKQLEKLKKELGEK
jgi:transcription initiation factor TFIIIB Brf1 subunit/transcription initiation factor TFIIB